VLCFGLLQLKQWRLLSSIITENGDLQCHCRKNLFNLITAAATAVEASGKMQHSPHMEPEQ
jgi:hypothetical protein